MRFLSGLMIAAWLVTGCSGSGASADGGENVRNTMRASLGTSTASHIVSASEDALLNRYGYQFERRVETTEDVRLETSWKELPATSDEKALGFGFARIRITVRARPRDRAAGTFSATLNAWVEGSGPASDIWVRIPVTDEREAYLKEVIDFLENEFKGGVRRGTP